MESDLKDLRYLYRYGEYITENERKMAEFMNSLDEETVEKMASTFTEGYRIGFVLGGKDLSKNRRSTSAIWSDLSGWCVWQYEILKKWD